jgi:AcrR family transcriptional regulator
MNQKIEHILRCAMTILKASGDQGLSMRKVAETADMRLSNVQYYFKTKELLLAALLEGFLLEYADSMRTLALPDKLNSKEKLHHLTLGMLNDIEKSECAMVFKEIWAIAERNHGVKKAIDDYYTKLHQLLFDALKKMAPAKCETQSINHAVAILLPFIEGYCITSSNLKVPADQLAKQLAMVLYTLLEQPQ